MARNYAKENKWESSPEQKKRRAQRNKARNEAIKAGLVKKGDGKELDHGRVPHGAPLPNSVKVVSRKENRSHQPKRK